MKRKQADSSCKLTINNNDGILVSTRSRRGDWLSVSGQPSNLTDEGMKYAQ